MWIELADKCNLPILSYLAVKNENVEKPANQWHSRGHAESQTFRRAISVI